MIKHYLKFWYPGTIFSESQSIQVSVRDVTPDPLPTRAIAWEYYDVEEQVINGELLKGIGKNHSPKTWRGRELTKAEALRDPDLGHIAKANIETNRMERVLKSPFGIFQMEPGDVAVDL